MARFKRTNASVSPTSVHLTGVQTCRYTRYQSDTKLFGRILHDDVTTLK